MMVSELVACWASTWGALKMLRWQIPPRGIPDSLVWGAAWELDFSCHLSPQQTTSTAGVGELTCPPGQKIRTQVLADSVQGFSLLVE